MHLLLASPWSDETTKWMVIGLGILTLVYVVMRPAFKRKDPMSRLSKGQTSSSLAQQRAAERDMSNLLVELSDMARQITAQLDTRAAKLELLIREAEEKIARLEALSRNGQPAGVSAVSDSPSGDAAYRVDETPEASPAFPRLPAATEPQHQIDARYSQIYQLADEGHSAQEIAHQLGRPNGEVQLILALRPRA